LRVHQDGVEEDERGPGVTTGLQIGAGRALESLVVEIVFHCGDGIIWEIEKRLTSRCERGVGDGIKDLTVQSME